MGKHVDGYVEGKPAWFRRRLFFPHHSEPRLVVDGKSWIHGLDGEDYELSPLLADLHDGMKRVLAVFGFDGRCGYRFCRDRQPLAILSDHDDICVSCWRNVKPAIDNLCAINRELKEVTGR